MYIIWDNASLNLKEVTLLLNIDEAKELRDSLDILIQAPYSWNHYHINNSEYSKEITIATFDESQKNGFSEEINKLIKHSRS